MILQQVYFAIPIPLRKKKSIMDERDWAYVRAMFVFFEGTRPINNAKCCGRAAKLKM